MSQSLKKFVRPGVVLLVAAACCSLAGCAAWNLRGDGYSDEDQKLTEGYRPAEPNSKPSGFSTKAQQIERNFGVGH